MNKIPVGRTIGQAYRFAFSNLATIIGIIWLPLGLLLAGEYALVRYYFIVRGTALATGNRFVLYGVAGDIYVFWVTAVFVQAIVTVPVLRQALGLRTRGARVHFALGIAELRLFAGYIAYDAVLFLLLVMVRFAWAVLTALCVWAAVRYGGTYGLADGAMRGWATSGLSAALLAATAFIYARLGFLLAPVVVAERRINLIRNWTLTEGNSWRALAVIVCVNVPAWLLYVAVQLGLAGFAIYGDVLGAFDVAGRVAQSASPVAIQMEVVLTWLPYLFSAWFLLEPLVLGLSSGAAAAAYRSLVPEDAAATASSPGASLSAALR